MPASLLVRSTILAATVLWAAAEVLVLRRPHRVEPARTLSTAGALLTLLHAMLAMHFVHGWNHAAAVAETARQTAALTGLAWGGGVYVNYLFLLIWIADAGWWWIAPASRARRPARLERARLVFFVFMFINGAIVFASTAGRIVGTVAVVAIGATWARSNRRDLARGVSPAQTSSNSVRATEGIQRGLADMKAGRTKPARDVFKRLRRKHGIPR